MVPISHTTDGVKSLMQKGRDEANEVIDKSATVRKEEF